MVNNIHFMTSYNVYNDFHLLSHKCFTVVLWSSSICCKDERKWMHRYSHRNWPGTMRNLWQSDMILRYFVSTSASVSFCCIGNLNVLWIQPKSSGLPYISWATLKHLRIQNKLHEEKFLRLTIKMLWKAPAI